MMVRDGRNHMETALNGDGPVLGREAGYSGDPVLYQDCADHKHGNG